MKLRMFTDLTHEIRTPFTLVMNPLKSMHESETDSRRKEMLNLIYRNVLRILRLLNQLMDVRKIDNQQLKMQFQETDLIYFIQDVIKSFEQLAIVRNIDFRRGSVILNRWNAGSTGQISIRFFSTYSPMHLSSPPIMVIY